MLTVIYSPGAQQDTGHAHALVMGLAPALAELTEVVVLAHTGPRPVVVEGVDVRSPGEASRPRMFGKWQRHLDRYLDEPRLLRELDEILRTRSAVRVFFETFEHRQLGQWVKRNPRIVYSTFFHSGNFSLGNRGSLRKVYKTAVRSGAKVVAEGALANYVFSATVKAGLEQTLGRPNAKIKVVVHPSLGPQMGMTASTSAAKSELGLDPERPVLTLFGTLHKERDFVLPLKAVRSREAWQVLVAGNEADVSYSEVRKVAADCGIQGRVTYLPRFIPASEHARIFGATDLLSLIYPPVMSHGIGTLNMSRSYGVPVLFSGPAEAEDYVLQEGVGFVLRSRDEFGVRAALDEFAEMDDAAVMALRGRVLDAAEKYSWDSFAADLVSCWGAEGS